MNTDPASFACRVRTIALAAPAAATTSVSRETQIQSPGYQPRRRIHRRRSEGSLPVTSGKTLTYRAKNYGTLDISKSLGRWEIGTTVVASDYRFIDNANTKKLEGYARVDLRADYRITPEWRLLGRVNNALDANYSLRDGYNTPGLNGFVGVEYRQR